MVNCSVVENHIQHLNFEALAKAKKISPDILKKFGLVDTDNGVLIPYFDMEGNQYPRQRIRTALKTGDGSRWTPGEEPIISYGLNRLQDAREEGFLILVEGESDCWKLWSSGFPAHIMDGYPHLRKVWNLMATIERIF